MTDESPGIAGKPIRTHYKLCTRARACVGAEVERMTEEKIGPSLIFLPFSQTERVPRSHARSPRTAPITILSPFLNLWNTATRRSKHGRNWDLSFLLFRKWR